MPDRPKMILFDYGQTLIDEGKFDGIKGTEAVLKYATRNKYNLSAERVQEEADLYADEVWYVGDQYECDIIGAGNAGIFPIWYQGATYMPCDEKRDVTTVKNWQEFRRLL